MEAVHGADTSGAGRLPGGVLGKRKKSRVKSKDRVDALFPLNPDYTRSSTVLSETTTNVAQVSELTADPGGSLEPRHIATAFQGFDNHRPRPKWVCRIVAKEAEPAIDDDNVVDLALALLDADMVCWEITSQNSQEKLGTKLALTKQSHGLRITDPDISQNAESLIYESLLVRDKSGGIRQSYLLDLTLISYWREVFSLYQSYEIQLSLGQLVMGTSAKDLIVNGIDKLIECMNQLKQVMVKAMARGVHINDGIQVSIRERWDQFDAIMKLRSCFNLYLDLLSGAIYWKADQTKALNLQWHKVQIEVEIAEVQGHGLKRKGYRGPKVDETPVIESYSSTKGINMTSTLMWVTFASTFASGIFICGEGYSHSNHKPGLLSDSDFWFVLQSSVMSGGSLLIMAIPMWRTKTRLTDAYVGMILAALCGILAPALYTRIPTEYTSALNVLAGAAQAFVTLQLAMMAKNDGMRTGSPKSIKTE